MDHMKRIKLARIAADIGEYAWDFSSGGEGHMAAAIETLGMRMAQQIVDAFALFEGHDVDVDGGLADFSWGMLDAYSEAAKRPLVSGLLYSCIEYSLLADHDVDVDAVRVARKNEYAAKAEAMKYEAGLSGKESV